MNLLDCWRGDNCLSRKQYWSIMCYDTYSYITVIRSRNLNLEFSPDHDHTYPTMIKQPMFASPCLHWDPQLETSYAVGTVCWRWECHLCAWCFWNSTSPLSLWVHMMGEYLRNWLYNLIITERWNIRSFNQRIHWAKPFLSRIIFSSIEVGLLSYL
jgi:hypothetical protein